ncbi:MAG: pyridoxine 5'-phosphate synthase [Flavobacteriales bacterium]
MTRLSVNVNKVATVRNARGGTIPDVLKAALNCEKYGADGITVHPRPDERHIKYQDVRELGEALSKEFNIEGYPSRTFLDLVKSVRPTQVTLVPDPPDALTSSAGWDTLREKGLLKEVAQELRPIGIRLSLFIETEQRMIEEAAQTGTDRVELYTEPYAIKVLEDSKEATAPFEEASEIAHSNGLGVNAGHDLDMMNLGRFVESVPHLKEVSIGHALIADALYYGLENTIGLYKREIQKAQREKE